MKWWRDCESLGCVATWTPHNYWDHTYPGGSSGYCQYCGYKPEGKPVSNMQSLTTIFSELGTVTHVDRVKREIVYSNRYVFVSKGFERWWIKGTVHELWKDLAS